jgi:glycerol-3-phosphate acyltransferase PlsX
MKIALDAMGGDYAPAHPVAAALRALEAYPQITRLVLVGDEEVLRRELRGHGAEPGERLHLFPTTQVIEMTDSAVDAVRRKKDSSLCRAVDLVKEGAVDAVVSAGNTGALVAACTIKLRTLPGVDRAGLACPMPSRSGVWLLLDAGASVDARPEHLVAYGCMGSIYAQHILGIARPRVGLLSVGTEDSKGNELTRATFPLLQQAPIHFIGNVEGHGLFEGAADVVVCDGFVGNITLKTAESLAKTTFKWIKEEIQSNPLRMAGALLAQGAFKTIKKKTNADEYGGALLLGVNGICVKAHGSSSVHALFNSLRVACESVTRQVNPLIIQALAPQTTSA